MAVKSTKEKKTATPKNGVVKAKKSSKTSSRKNDDDEDDDFDEEEETDDWGKTEEDDDNWDPDFAEFDLPKRNKKISIYNNIMDNTVRIKIPNSVKQQAKYAFKLKELGFLGGQSTGWKRARQLANDDTISIEDLQNMKSWFARHKYTSYPGYSEWIKAGKPLDDNQWHNTRSIIAWMTWGSDAGFKLVNSDQNIKLLNKHYPLAVPI